MVSVRTPRASDVLPMKFGMNITSCKPGGIGTRSVTHLVPLCIPSCIPPYITGATLSGCPCSMATKKWKEGVSIVSKKELHYADILQYVKHTSIPAAICSNASEPQHGNRCPANTSPAIIPATMAALELPNPRAYGILDTT
jgi:hypothetical protein